LKSLINACLSDDSNLEDIKRKEALEMSRTSAAIREKTSLTSFLEHTKKLILDFKKELRIKDKTESADLLRFYDTLISRMMILTSMNAYSESGGVNRGSGLYTVNGVPDKNKEIDPNKEKIQMVSLSDGEVRIRMRDVFRIPDEDDFFENVWREFRENKW